MTNTKTIKAVLGFKKVTVAAVLARGNAVLLGVYGDTADYAKPPIDQPTFKSQLDALSAANSAALDGGKQAIAERERQKEIVIKSMRQLGHYVEENCKDDMPTFLKSGFEAVTTTRAVATPASDHFRKIVPGQNSGQMEATLVAQRAALAHQLRYAAVGQGGVVGTWVELPIGSIKPATVISGLTPGTTYVFQVRAQTKSGYTDWSESVTRICM